MKPVIILVGLFLSLNAFAIEVDATRENSIDLLNFPVLSRALSQVQSHKEFKQLLQDTLSDFEKQDCKAAAVELIDFSVKADLDDAYKLERSSPLELDAFFKKYGIQKQSVEARLLYKLVCDGKTTDSTFAVYGVYSEGTLGIRVGRFGSDG